ncbi:MAG: ferric reductase-like transmembrane domain-containing protein [Mycobacteriales bacterium]
MTVPVGVAHPLSRRAVAALLLGVLAAGAAAVLWLWTAQAEPVRGWAGWLTAGGRILGLLGAYLLLVEVFLMARVPWLDHRLGSDWISSLHRALGEYLICLLLGHAVLITAGYALTDHRNVAAESAHIVLTYQDVLRAAVALGLLCVIGVASARAVRRRLRYPTWHGIHLYAYLALFLAYGHQTAVGADFTTDRAAATVWKLLHVAVGLCVVAFRFGGPVRRAVRHRLHVTHVVPEAEGVVSVYVSGTRMEELRAAPGQYFRWRFLTRDRWWQAHPFSVSGTVWKDGRCWLRITVKALGDDTAGLQRLRPGTRVLVEGPYGAFTPALRRGGKVLLFAGGVGITPLRAMFDVVPPDTVLLYRASRPGDLALSRELDAYASAGRLTVHYLLGHRRTRPDPLDPRRLRRLVPDIADRDVFLCGPPGMVSVARRALRATGVRPSRIHTENFAY